jgi:hypothetical protein
MTRKKRMVPALRDIVRKNRKVFLIWTLLRLLVLAALVLSAVDGRWDNVFICVLVWCCFSSSFLEHRFRIEVPSGLQLVIFLHIFAAEILGELSAYYVRFAYWDTLLHTVWGFLCAAIGYSLVDILNNDNRLHFSLSPLYLAVARSASP